MASSIELNEPNVEFDIFDSDSGTKRKGLLLSREDPIKKQASSNNLALKRHGSLPDISFIGCGQRLR